LSVLVDVMPAPKTFQVAGVDGCKAGWYVAAASAHQTSREGLGCTLQLETLFVTGTFADVLSKTQNCKLVCVDIPIGLMTPELQERVREVHPEVSFWVLNGSRPIGQSKKTTGGRAQRCRLLRKVFAEVDSILTGMEGPGCAADDALDAFVAAWTAAQAVCEKTSTLPENPVCDSRGLRMEMSLPGCVNLCFLA
jgi:predicted RNase H-like nuclease